jgi:uncharacterized protein (DUF1778 family)
MAHTKEKPTGKRFTTQKTRRMSDGRVLRADSARVVRRPVAKEGQDRFDAKLPVEQKQFFEKAADIGRYRSLSDFVLKAAQEKAEEIIAQHESFLSSEKDREVFFHALMNPPAPNARLQNAMKDYMALIGRA